MHELTLDLENFKDYCKNKILTLHFSNMHDLIQGASDNFKFFIDYYFNETSQNETNTCEYLLSNIHQNKKYTDFLKNTFSELRYEIFIDDICLVLTRNSTNKPFAIFISLTPDSKLAGSINLPVDTGTIVVDRPCIRDENRSPQKYDINLKPILIFKKYFKEILEITKNEYNRQVLKEGFHTQVVYLKLLNFVQQIFENEIQVVKRNSKFEYGPKDGSSAMVIKKYFPKMVLRLNVNNYMSLEISHHSLKARVIRRNVCKIGSGFDIEELNKNIEAIYKLKLSDKGIKIIR